MHNPISLIGVPTDIGAGARGASMGPEALRVAGIQTVLESHGLQVTDCGNLSGPANPWQLPTEGYRHLAEVAAWNQTLHDAVHAELTRGRMPIVLGGDHCLGLGSISAVARLNIRSTDSRKLGSPATDMWFLPLDARRMAALRSGVSHKTGKCPRRLAECLRQFVALCDSDLSVLGKSAAIGCRFGQPVVSVASTVYPGWAGSFPPDPGRSAHCRLCHNFATTSGHRQGGGKENWCRGNPVRDTESKDHGCPHLFPSEKLS